MILLKQLKSLNIPIQNSKINLTHIYNVRFKFEEERDESIQLYNPAFHPGLDQLEHMLACHYKIVFYIPLSPLTND